MVAQPPRKPFQSQSVSTITYGAKDSAETVDINNVSYQLSGDSLPGLAPAERLVLRQTTRWKQILGDKGGDATVTLEAWLLGADLGQKPCTP